MARGIRIDWFDQTDRVGTPGAADFTDLTEATEKVGQLQQQHTVTSVNINYGSGRQQWARKGDVPGGTWVLEYDYNSDRDNGVN